MSSLSKNLPLPGIDKLVTPTFFRSCVHAAKELGKIKAIAVSIDATAVQYLPNPAVAATDTYNIKVANPGTVENEYNIWVKLAKASVAQQKTKYFLDGSYSTTALDASMYSTFANGIPDYYYLGGPTSIDVAYNPTVNKVFTGMRYYRIDGETTATRFTQPADSTSVFPYLGRPASYLLNNIQQLNMPLEFHTSSQAGAVKTIVPLKYRGKITELLAAGATGTPRQASYYDACPPATATHFAVYSTTNNVVTLTIEARP